LRLHRSPPVSCLPGQKNQGGVGIPQTPPRIVCNLDCDDISTGDDDNNDDDNNLCGGRKTLRAIDVGTGLRLCVGDGNGDCGGNGDGNGCGSNQGNSRRQWLQ
jgi:hypothetical protein